MDSVFKALLTAGCLLLLTGQDVRGDNPAFCTGRDSLLREVFKDECGYTLPASGSPHMMHTREELCANTEKRAEVAGCVKTQMDKCQGDKFKLTQSLLPSKSNAKALYDTMCGDEKIKFDCINNVMSSNVQEALMPCIQAKVTDKKNNCQLVTKFYDCVVDWLKSCDKHTALQVGSKLRFMVTQGCNDGNGAPTVTVSLTLLLATLLAWAGCSV